MTGFLILLIFGATVCSLVWALRQAAARRQALEAERARAHAEYVRQRAEFLTTASPMEVQAFLIQEQTNALIEAQRRNARALGLAIWLNGPHIPFGDHHRIRE